MTDIQFLIYTHSLTMVWLYVNNVLKRGGACLSTKLLQYMCTLLKSGSQILICDKKIAGNEGMQHYKEC